MIWNVPCDSMFMDNSPPFWEKTPWTEFRKWNLGGGAQPGHTTSLDEYYLSTKQQ